MKITDFLDAAMVIPDLKGGDKNTVLKEMAEWMASHDQSMDARRLLEVLLEREKISSTAIGEGVAIPHGKMPSVQQVSAVFARSSQGVDFDSLDGGTTHLFFLLIAPENSAADHLKALARISRLLKDTTFRARLLNGKTREEIFNAIKEEDQKF
ncbi:MAG: PTS sugar transporter subunit IIA [Deltaproteobacteria bacterium]|nr:PTS sugar transporter subunit IIA [Deltaproteobacteria bacterium]MCZ6625795.1 PTS sugar transporter subunit IIA [Deltaproteobacteria bacterium]